MDKNQEQDSNFKKTSTLSTYFENENVEKIQSFIKNDLTDKDILNMRFTSSKKTLLIKLVLLECSQFTSLFELIKEKISEDDLKIYVNMADEDSNTPLLYAAFKGNYEKVECLIKHGAKVEMRNFMGLSVMHMAAEGDKPNMLIYFKSKYGFSVNDRDFPGNTPLHWACHMAAENSINFLLSWIDDINILDRKGQTPLHLGIFYLRPKMIKKLLRKGADVNLKDFSGRSVMDILNDPKLKVPNFKGALKVIHNNQQFKLCVYPNENKDKDKDDKNNYKELFNGFKDNNLKEQLIDKSGNSVKEGETSKSYLTYHKIFNSVMFICLHLFFEFLLFYFLLPKINIHLYYIVFWLLIITLFVSFYLVNKSDPGFLEAKDNLTWLQMVENKVHINEYCPYCRVKITSSVKHCHICKRCISGFDHHCNWIDNCVGEKNKMRFIFFVSTTLFNLIFNFCISLTAIQSVDVQNGNNAKKGKYYFMKNIEAILNMSWMFNYRITDLVAILILIVSSFFFIPVFYVLWNQIKNLVLGNKN